MNGAGKPCPAPQQPSAVNPRSCPYRVRCSRSRIPSPAGAHAGMRPAAAPFMTGNALRPDAAAPIRNFVSGRER